MDDERHSPSNDYLECARRLRQLHALIRSGDGDSDQAEELRDEMDDFWIRMSPEERACSGDLSADLHVLGERESLFLDRPIDGTIRPRFLDAIRSEDRAGLRSLLAADFIIAGHFDRALFRSVYWASLKDFESSLEFLESLSGRVRDDRTAFEVDFLTLEQLAPTREGPHGLALIRAVGRGTLQRIDQVADELEQLMADLRSMRSPENPVGDGSAAWVALKEKFFRAEEHARAFSQSAA